MMNHTAYNLYYCGDEFIKLLKKERFRVESKMASYVISSYKDKKRDASLNRLGEIDTNKKFLIVYNKCKDNSKMWEKENSRLVKIAKNYEIY